MPSTAIVSDAHRDRMVTVPAGREARRDTGIQGGFASCARRIEGFAEATRGHPWSTSRLLAVGPGMALPPQCDRVAPTNGGGRFPVSLAGWRLDECTWGVPSHPQRACPPTDA